MRPVPVVFVNSLGIHLVGDVRAINGQFGANCSKAIKFGPDVDRTLLDRFRVDAKKGFSLGHLNPKWPPLDIRNIRIRQYNNLNLKLHGIKLATEKHNL